MHLSSIGLSQITEEEFHNLRARLVRTLGEEFQVDSFLNYERFRSLGPFDFFRIKNAMYVHGGYETLLAEFRENKFAARAVIFDGTERSRCKAALLADDYIKNAASAVRGMKPAAGWLELYFKPHDECGPPKDENCEVAIKFIEYNGNVTSYEILFPRNCWTAFAWTTVPDLRRTNSIGLWVPKKAL